jgi:hypothetical protein
MTTYFLPFTSSLPPGLSAPRATRNRAVFPELPARFEDIQVAVKAVETIFSKKNAFGFAMMHQKNESISRQLFYW